MRDGAGETPGTSWRALAPRDHFPALETQAYLNAAGIGLTPLAVQATVIDLVTAIGTGGTSAYFERYDQIMTAPRLAAARLFNAKVDDVAVITSVSEVVSQIAWWRRPRRGENVVVVDIDSAAVTYPWLRVAEETGCEVRFVRAADDPAAFRLDDIVALMDDNTAAVSVSHVQWVTGLKLDLPTLGRHARARDALLVVDAFHSAGVTPFSAEDLEAVDFMATGAFKWLLGFAGAGAVYVNPRQRLAFRPILVGSRTADPPPPFKAADSTAIELPDDARRFEYGSSITVPRVAFGAAVNYLADIGFGEIQAHAQRLGARLMDGVQALGGEVVTPAAAADRAGIISLRFPGWDANDLYEALLARQVATAPRNGFVRFAPHAFNDDRDIDRALTALCEILSART